MSKRSCDQAVERIYFYLDGEITWYRRLRINWHLRSCRMCEGAYDFEHRFRSVVRDKCSEDVPDELLERLRSVLRENDQ
jgi:mycothiol system anti-sigma-R factor